MSGRDRRLTLVEFLRVAFDSRDLRRWVRDHFPGPIAGHVPETGSRSDMASDVAQLFEDHGSIDREFFQLLRQARPGRNDEIDQVERVWLDHAPAPRRPLPPVAVPPSRTASHDFRLTILLDRLDRSGVTLEVRYRLPGSDPSRPRVIPWAELAGPLEAACTALDQGKPKAIRRALTPDELGVALFRVLFGGPGDWQPLLRLIYQQPAPEHPRPTPRYRGIRVAIRTDDPLLASLPWRLTSYERRPLVASGWRFSVTHQSDPSGDHTMTVPTTFILVTPRTATTPDHDPDSRHPQAIAEMLAALWPHSGQKANHIRHVASRKQLENALSGIESNRAILYVYTAVVQHDGQQCLVLDAPSTREDPDSQPDRLPIARLSEIFEKIGRTPRLVYLNTAGLPLRDPLAHSDVPLVIWRRTASRTPRSITLAVDWLRRWLGKDGDADPIDALHHVCNRDLHTCAEAGTLGVRSAYRTWNTHRQARLDRSGSPRNLLDRDIPKALTFKHLGELAHGLKRRVLVIMAHAEPGNRIVDLSRQLRHYLDGQGESGFAINWRTLTFPDQRHQLATDLEHQLREDLEADPGEPTGDLLRRHSPQVRGQVRRILWLDWGTCGKGQDQATLKKVHLREWMQFVSRCLVTHCPDDLRLVAYLAIETTKTQAISEYIKRQRKEPWARKAALWFNEMRPEQVSEEHLQDYLRNHTRCDDDLQIELAELLHEIENGDFARTVDRLEPAAATDSWLALVEELRNELGKKPAAAADDDEEF